MNALVFAVGSFVVCVAFIAAMVCLMIAWVHTNPDRSAETFAKRGKPIPAEWVRIVAITIYTVIGSALFGLGVRVILWMSAKAS